MPLWYSSIAAEHRAVREAAGLFDCTHMGVLKVSGDDAGAFLNLVATNDVATLKVGRAQYSYILDAAGNVLDDIIVYRRAESDLMVVVNAANEPKIKFYLAELLAGRVVVDAEDPERTRRATNLSPTVRDMRDTHAGGDCRVDIALQGPASVEALIKLVDDAAMGRSLSSLKGFAFIEGRIGGIDCLVSTTGYTGSETGFELFVPPAEAPKLWNLILEVGEPLGVLPCGLGARDSLRIEAGLPLYGHELDGKFGISPFEAGYGWAVKLGKGFFIGKPAMERIATTYEMQVARSELPGTRGIRPVRVDDAVLDERGACAGWVLSSAKVGEDQMALVYVDRQGAREGTTLGVHYLARSPSQVQQGRKERIDKGQTVEADLTGKVVSRFARF
jgi:glycine hydroxymethyltransferase